MYTPSELRDKTFKSGLGYDKKDVEQFLTELSSDYELMIQENEDLKKKITDLNNSISYYKSIEKTLQKALVIAEKTAQDIKANAIKEAEVIELEAKARAKAIQTEAGKQLELIEHKTINLVQQYDYFKIHFENLLNTQLELINSESFSINTADFTYQEQLMYQTLSESMNEIPSEKMAEETNQIHLDLPNESSEHNPLAVDDFEFINLKEETI